MKIQAIPMQPASSEGGTEPSAQVVMLKVSGPIDPKDAVLQRARELVVRTGSMSMVESFDWAVSTGVFVPEN